MTTTRPDNTTTRPDNAAAHPDNTAHPAPTSPATALVASLVILSVSTGILDAVSYLALDQVFTGNMTGNVLFIGFALGGLTQLPVLNLLLALVCFGAGAALATLVLRRPTSGGGVPRRSFWILVTGMTLTAVTGLVWLLVGELSDAMLAATTGLLALVLGAQAAALKQAGVRDISTVVVTMTIVNLANDGWLAGKRDPHWLRKVLGIVAMGLGAFTGSALVIHVSGPIAVFAAALVMAAGIVTLWRSQRAS